MRIESLAEFATLARTLNYRQAAAELFVSKSTLSKHIYDLEEELGIVLFERDTHSVVLTNDGERFNGHVRKILDAYDAMRADMRLGDEAVCLGVPIKFPLTSQLVSDLIVVARKQLDSLEIRVVDSGFEANVVALLDSGCDIVLATYAPDTFESRLSVTPLGQYRAQVWINAGDPLAKRESVSLEDLSSMLFRSTSSKGTYWDRALKAQLERYGFTPRMGETVDDMFRLEPGEYSFVYAGMPTASFGFDSVMVPLEEDLTFMLVAICDRNRKTSQVANVLRMLQKVAASQGANQSADQGIAR